MTETSARMGAPLERRDVLILALAVALALVVRLFFFRTATSIDEFNYLRHAGEVWRGRFVLGDSSYLHATRGAVFMPVALMFSLMGVSDLAIAIWPLLASLATVVAVYLLVRKLLDREAAVYAVALSIYLPMLVKESTQILPGAIMNLIIVVSVYFFFAAEQSERRRNLWLIGSGAVFGIMPLTGELGLLFGVFYPIAVVVCGRYRPWTYWPIAASFLAMVLVNLVYYWIEAGDPFLKMVISRSILTTEIPAFRPFYYLNVLVRPFAAHGGVLYLAVPGALWALRNRDRRLLATALWLVCTWLLLEYSSSSLSEYRPLYKYTRYASMMAVPGLILAAAALRWLRLGVDKAATVRGLSRGVVAVVAAMVLLLFTSVHMLRASTGSNRAQRDALEIIGAQVRSFRGRTIYTTHWLWNTKVGYFMDYDMDYLPSGYTPYHAVDIDLAAAGSRNKYVQTLGPGENMDAGLLIHDEALFAGSQGQRAISSVGRGEIPETLAHIPPTWSLVAKVEFGGHAVSLYSIPVNTVWPGSP